MSTPPAPAPADTSHPAGQTRTVFGHWDDAGVPVAEFALPGVVEDGREDDGEHDGGLWAQAVTATTEDAAVLAAWAELGYRPTPAQAEAAGADAR
jgi:hypothetical protein